MPRLFGENRQDYTLLHSQNRSRVRSLTNPLTVLDTCTQTPITITLMRSLSPLKRVRWNNWLIHSRMQLSTHSHSHKHVMLKTTSLIISHVESNWLSRICKTLWTTFITTHVGCADIKFAYLSLKTLKTYLCQFSTFQLLSFYDRFHNEFCQIKSSITISKKVQYNIELSLYCWLFRVIYVHDGVLHHYDNDIDLTYQPSSIFHRAFSQQFPFRDL